MTQEMWISGVAMLLTMMFNFWYTKSAPTYKKFATVWNLIAAVVTQAINGVVAASSIAHPAIAPASTQFAAVTATLSFGSSFFAQVASFVVNTAIQTALTTGLHSWPKNFVEGVKNGFRSAPKAA